MNKLLKGIRDNQGVYAVHVIVEEVNYVYIGSGKLGDRVVGNGGKLRRNTHANKLLQEKYNIVKELKIEILDICKCSEEARELENFWMEYYRKLDGVVVCNKYKSVNTKKYELKLDVEKVLEIKQLLAEGKMKGKEIAELYGVHQCEISKIKMGKRWANVVAVNTGIDTAIDDSNISL